MSVGVAPDGPGAITVGDVSVPDEALLPRGERAREMEAVLRATRYRVAVARFGHAALLVAPWLVSAASLGTLAAVLHAQITRPAPAAEVHIAVVSENGRPEHAGLRENLPPDRLALVVKNTITWQLFWREEYVWEGVRDNWDAVRATAAPDERARYEAQMQDRNHPRNPMRLYGSGPDAAKARVVDWVVQQHPDTPYAATIPFMLVVQPPKGQPECRVRKTARATFVDARQQMPPDVQTRYSPAGYAFASWVSDADPGQALAPHCMRYVAP